MDKTRAAMISVAATIIWVAMAVPARCSVYELADGVVRGSYLNGAKEAYLRIILPISHAANLLALPDGDLLCFWFSGAGEGGSGVSIVMSRLVQGSSRWTEPVLLSHRDGWSNQNPVPFRAPDGRLWLFHTSQKAGQGQQTAEVLALKSQDDGQTWTAPEPLFAEPGSFDRQHLVVFNRHWLFPMYHSAGPGIINSAQKDTSMVKISDDDGVTWRSCEVPGSGGLVQMNIVDLSPQSLVAFFRSRYADWVYKSVSGDGCQWSAPSPTQLPNNNSSIQVARLRNGHLVLAFDNAQASGSRGEPRTAPRAVLSVALSVDDGKTWPWVRDVQAGPTPPAFLPAEALEYSYPSITQTPDDSIHMAFTFRRETIKYVTFDEEWITQGQTIGLFTGDRAK